MGSISMVESTRQVQSRDPFDRFDEAVNDPRLYETYERADLSPYGRMDLAPYERTERTELAPVDSSHEPVPLFLSDYEDDRYQDGPDYTFGKQKPLRSPFRVSRILFAVAALAAAAGGAALYSMDSTRSAIVNTKASLAGVAPVPFGTTPPEAAPQQPRVAAVSPVTPEAPAMAQAPAPEVQVARRSQPGALASTSPSREEITAAYQTAIKSRVVAVEPTVREAPATPPPPAAPAVRRMDPDELAALLKRAKGLLAIGDITAARLLLERAADAQEAEAAFVLAGTYDPQVLGVQDMRSITPDPAMARSWYQKAAQLGSADARRRLQSQN
jgi:TPR repeat protein